MNRVSRFSRFEIAIAILATIGVCAPWIASASGDDATKTMVCHRGNLIDIGTPAVLAAHLAHGDCIDTCDDCVGRCCIKGGSFELTLFDCAKIDGRFQYDPDSDCFAGGD